MNKSEYNQKRSFAIRLFGMIMIVVSAFVLVFNPLQIAHEKNHATSFVTGRVVSIDGDNVKVYYTLPGEAEGWLVTMHGEGWAKGDEVRVFYNPDDLSEKYIEGFEENPWDDVMLAISGLALGLCALFIPKASKKSAAVNEIIDLVDR